MSFFLNNVTLLRKILRLNVLNALSNTSELSGHKVEQHKWLQQLRLEHAAHLLVDEPERTIAQVATDCGFGSSAYFSDRFRQHYGMSPSDFRIEATK